MEIIRFRKSPANEMPKQRAKQRDSMERDREVPEEQRVTVESEEQYKPSESQGSARKKALEEFDANPEH